MKNCIQIKHHRKILDIVHWANLNCGSDYSLDTTYPGIYNFVFRNPEHATMFALKWT